MYETAYVFCFKQKTAYELRISDWSSDVCSSDLGPPVAVGLLTPDQAAAFRTHADARRAAPAVDEEQFRLITGFNDIFVSIAAILLLIAEIGRAACRESVCQYV